MAKNHALIPPSNKPFDFRTTKQKAEDSKVTMHAIEAVKMITLLTLRNQGWGTKRLKEFNEQWNRILENCSDGRLSLTDIADTIYDETGLRHIDLRLDI